MKILVFQTAFLGDLLLSIPLLKNIKNIYPEAELTLVCRKGFGSFFRFCGLVDSVFEINKKDSSDLKSKINQLKSHSFDYIFCPHESFRSASIVGSLKAKEKVSFRRWFSFLFFNVRVPRPIELADALRQMSLLVPLNRDFALKWIQTASDFKSFRFQKLEDFGEFYEVPSWASMNVQVSDGLPFFNKELDNINFSNGVGFAPGSVWNTKKWKEEHFINLSKMLIAEGKKVFLLGSPSESEICNRIASENPQVINLCAKTNLEDLYLVLRKLNALVSNDSGTMHMASVAGTPSVSVFGPTTLDIGYRPWQNKALVAEVSLKCRPCGKHGHDKCPIKTHECMQAVKPHMVQSLLSKLT